MDQLIMAILASVGFLFIVLYIKERVSKINWKSIAEDAISELEDLKEKIEEKL